MISAREDVKAVGYIFRMYMTDAREAEEVLRLGLPLELFPRCWGGDFQTLTVCDNGAILLLLWANFKPF